MMKFIAGVDGGGTAAKLEMCGMDGRLLCRERFGPLNITGTGADAYAEQLREIFRFCENMADCASLCIGGAGVTQTQTAEIVRRELRAAGFSGHLTLCGDHEIALRGAMEGPGCILIAGTGSIVYGINASGQKARVGGYGHLIDDCGSGYALGQNALAHTVRTLDGRIPGNLLTETVMEFLDAKDAADIVNFVYAAETGKAGIASLAPVVIKTAAADEPYSLEILRKNAGDLAQMAGVLIRRLALERPRIAFLGGLLAEDNLYRRMTAENLSASAEVVTPGHDALHGAVSIAAEALRHQ